MFRRYDPDWRFGIPKSDPETSYDYVKNLKYVKLDKQKFIQKFPTGSSRLKHSFISDNKIIYHIQFNNQLTSVYQLCFHSDVNESIDNFLNWLKSQIY